MQMDFNDYEYNNIVKDILNNREIKKLEGYTHHGTNRLDHSRRVSFYSYKICKKWNLDYESAARGGLLHDFFYNTYKGEQKRKLLINHPMFALYNSKKHFKLNCKEVDIIRTHMFPLNITTPPKYYESYIITFVDKVACIYERFIGCKLKVNFNISKLMIYMLFLMSN